MKSFGGKALFLDRDDINTDEIIPAKYLVEISKTALKPHLLEDLLIDGRKFDNSSTDLAQASVIVARNNFGCGSSREHVLAENSGKTAGDYDVDVVHFKSPHCMLTGRAAAKIVPGYNY